MAFLADNACFSEPPQISGLNTMRSRRLRRSDVSADGGRARDAEKVGGSRSQRLTLATRKGTLFFRRAVDALIDIPRSAPSDEVASSFSIHRQPALYRGRALSE